MFSAKRKSKILLLLKKKMKEINTTKNYLGSA